MTRQRAEVQDSWKEFTQNVMKLSNKKDAEEHFRNNSELKMLTEQPPVNQDGDRFHNTGQRVMEMTPSVDNKSLPLDKQNRTKGHEI